MSKQSNTSGKTTLLHRGRHGQPTKHSCGYYGQLTKTQVCESIWSADHTKRWLIWSSDPTKLWSIWSADQTQACESIWSTDQTKLWRNW